MRYEIFNIAVLQMEQVASFRMVFVNSYITCIDIWYYMITYILKFSQSEF